MSKSFFFLLILICLLDIYSALARIPEGQESYEGRPDILLLKGQSHNGLGEEWEKLKKGHLEMIAMLFESYQDQHYYFLARDSELLYDFARLAARNDPDLLSRIHLINVSRDNMYDPHLKDYLKQEGISEELLHAGKKIIFIDTGFKGTIPRVIAEKFPEKVRGQLQTHLVCSANSEHPSSRVFLSAIDRSAAKKNPISMYWSLFYYEHMPRYTDRSGGFVYEANRWQAFSPISGQYDGIVSKDLAKKYQEDLRAFVLKNEEVFHERRKIWRQLRQMNSQEAVEKIKELLKLNPNDAFYEALARDYIEMSKTNLAHLKIDLAFVGLEKSILNADRELVIRQFPHWEKYFNDPVVEIKKLIENEKWEELRHFYVEVSDIEMNKILAKLLGRSELSSEGKKFIRFLIIKGDQSLLRYLEEFTFSSPHIQGADYKIMREAIKISDAKDREAFLMRKESLKRAVEKSCQVIRTTILNALEQLRNLSSGNNFK